MRGVYVRKIGTYLCFYDRQLEMGGACWVVEHMGMGGAMWGV